MFVKKVTTQEDFRAKIKTSMNMLSGIVGKTLGPGGLPILLERKGIDAAGLPLKPHITKDGVTVARSVLSLEDKVEDSIVSTVLEVAEKTNEEAGDGTTTAIVLADALYNEGLKYISTGESPVDIFHEIQTCIEEVVKRLDECAVKIDDNEEMVRSVASISANNNQEIGDIVFEAINEVGEDGVITLDDGYGRETRLRLESGFKIMRGLIHPELFYNKKGEGICDLEDVAIIIYDGEIKNPNDILPIILKLTENGTKSPAFLIIAREIEGYALNTLSANKNQGGLDNFAMIRGPNMGHVRTNLMQDIAVATGAKMIIQNPEDLTRNLKEMTLEDLGYAKKVRLTKRMTIIYEGGGDENEVMTRISELKSRKKTADSPYDAMMYDGRIACLTGSIAVIEVGATTEAEMKEKKDRVEDSLNATKAAISEGVIAGGGAMLLYIGDRLKEKTIGAKIVKRALEEPMRRIIENVGQKPDYIVESIRQKHKKDLNFGYNGKTREIQNMMDNKVIDPVKVTKTALRNAVSIANLLLTCGGSITVLKDNSSQMQMPSGM